MTVRAEIAAATDRIVERSKLTRTAYLERMHRAADKAPRRSTLSCGNLAHGFAACGLADKQALTGEEMPNLAIVTAYNDMLSAHQPFECFPQLIKEAARAAGGVAQVAGGVPAMCDGVTQGQPGMELSLFSRDVIALSAGIALSHNMFDAALYLGVCDKIVPGLLIAALNFGHLPAVFVPAGPMTSGLPNPEKASIRQLYAEGTVGREALLEAESKSYHGPGTCTFYGTANSNQMLMEIMGLHLPGASFVNPGTPLRDALTAEATRRALAITTLGNAYMPVATNHTLHLVAMARAAGIIVTWEDFAALSDHVPLLTRIYPNGQADVNHFHAAGGMGFLIGELLDAGLLHEDVRTVWGTGLAGYRKAPRLEDGALRWADADTISGDETVLRPATNPFSENGGLMVLDGNLGRAVIKVSAVKPEHHIVEAPAVIFHSQDNFMAAFHAGDLDQDLVAVIRFQGPKANGMPELHKLTPLLGVLQDRGRKVALLTDGRMSGASGKVPAAIHVTPEAADGGPIASIRAGDLIRLDARAGRVDALVDADDWASREPAIADLSENAFGMGREMFGLFRAHAGSAETGACALNNGA